LTQRSAQENLRQGIDAAKRGDKLAARRHLQQVLIADRNNEIAWMWMASVVDTLEERRRCLERALQINPNNDRAREALKRLGGNVPPSGRSADTDDDSRAGSYVPRDSGRRGPNPYIIGAAAVLVLVVGVIIAGVLTNRPAQTVTPTDDVDATFAVIVAVQASNTPDTRPPTETPLPGVVVTYNPEEAQPLPPTFTPTFTPTPSETPTPTPAPLPLENLNILYSDLASGASTASLFSNTAEGVGETPLDPGDYNDVAISPDGTRIAFVRTITYTLNEQDVTAPELFVAPLDTPTDITQITQLGGAAMEHPSWSPDSTELVFASNADNDFEIYRVAASGGAPRQLTVNESADTDPDWSPNGDVIAYASDQDSPTFLEIYTMDLFGNNVTRITDASGNNFSPRWSPDGSQFAFVSDRTGRGEIFLMLTNGNGQVMLTVGDGEAENLSPIWSPDARWIAFKSNRATESSTDKFQWFIMDTRGENVRPIVLTDREPQSLAFLPTR
jgi:hypothetical protein